MLICLEGPNGVGKSTLAQTLHRALNPRQTVTVVTDTLVSRLAHGATPAAYHAARTAVADRYRLADTHTRIVILERWHL